MPYGIIGVFAVAWIISFIVYRVKKLDDVEIANAEAVID